MLTPAQIQAELSLAYLQALAAISGYSLDTPRIDMDSVDAVISAAGKPDPASILSSPRIEVQLKATQHCPVNASGEISFPLPIKNYHDLRVETAVPRLLVVLCLPQNPVDWLTHTASWSGFAGPAPDVPRAVKFSSDYVPVIERVITQLRPRDTEATQEFVGQISQTKADPDPHTRQEGEVVLNYIAGDSEKVAKARILLPREEYDRAVEAHKQGNTVKVTGTLRIQGRIRIIENPLFEVIP